MTVGLLASGRPVDIAFEKLTLDLGANETCAFADINGDGRLDIVSGENWFEAPKWTRHHFRDLPFTNNYIDDFSDLPLDVNGDGKDRHHQRFLVRQEATGFRIPAPPASPGPSMSSRTPHLSSSRSWSTWITTGRRGSFCRSSAIRRRRSRGTR